MNRSFALLLLFAAVLLLLPAGAAAQTLTLSNGATLTLDGGAVLDLGSATTLVETGGARLTGGTGTVRAERTLNAPASEDVAGLGAVITSAANLGLTTVVRGHVAQTVDGNAGVARYYDLTPATNTGLAATLVFRYRDGELGGLTEADLALHRSTDGGTTWTEEGGTVDAVANTITLSGIDAFSRWTAAASIPQALALAGEMLLQGPFSGSAMTVALSAELPQSDPYGLGQSVAAPDFFTADPAGQNVVDWVWVELRTGDPAAPPMTIEAARAALLMSDGTIKDTDGTSDVAFSGLAPGTYYLAVGHRNHLAVMSSVQVDFTTGTGTHDFTASGSAYGTNPMILLTGALYGLYGGDGNASGGITAPDQSLWLGQNGTSGYLWGDYNLSGGATSSDQSLWLGNNGTSTQVPPGN